MRTIPLCWRTLTAGAVLMLALSPAFAAPAGSAADKDDAAVNSIDRLRKALDQPITVKIDKQTLTTAVEKLASVAKAKIILDTNTIQQLGWTPDQVSVEGDFQGMKLRSVLRTILAPYTLTYAPIGDCIVVTTEDMAMTRQLRQRISVDMDKVEFAGALRQISRDTAVNLIVDSRAEKEAAAKVSLRLEDVPLETAVRLLAEMAGLKPVRVGNVLFVTTKANANEMRNDPDLGQPNPNAPRAQEAFLQQQLLQNAQVQFQLGGLAGPAAPQPGIPPLIPPPGIQPVAPPAAPLAPAAGAPQQDKDSPPADSKPPKP